MLKKVMILIFSVLVVILTLDVLFTFFIDCDNNLKSSYRIKESINAEVIVLGASNVEHAFDPNYFEEKTGLSAYNLATNNSNVNENFAHLYLYLQHNSAPKYLIYHVSPRTFDERFLLFNTYRFVHHSDNDVIKALIQEEDEAYTKYRQIPFMRYAYYNNYTVFYAFQGLKHWVTNKSEGYFRSGFYTVDRDWDGDIKNHLNTYGNNGGIYYDWSSKREKQMVRLIKYAKQKGIQLIFYKTPLYKKIRKFITNRDKRLIEINEFSKGYGVPYWNFDDLYFSDNPEYFNEITSTNSKGTSILMDAIIQEYLKEVE